MKQINKVTTDLERAFYGSKDTEFDEIHITGPIDGESAFKECRNNVIHHSSFDLRYPFWHNDGLAIDTSVFAYTCRAAFWYSKNITIDQSYSAGIKAFRECENIVLTNTTFISEEIFWRCNEIKINNCKISGFYAFFESKHIVLEQVAFDGKYSFQYVEDLKINQSTLKTKDAFWHSKNAVVTDSVIEGEYLGWYSENLTLIRCHIKGTQPLCYCKNLKLIDCTFDADADLAFEYSEVNGSILNNVTSIKNMLKGKLQVQSCSNIIFDENDKSNGNAIIKIQSKI